MPKYKCIEKPQHITKSTVPFVATNLEFKNSDYYADSVYVLLCYNDDPDPMKCHYTVALYGNEGFITPEFANKWLQGWIPQSITSDDIKNCVDITFLKSFSEEPERKSSIMDEVLVLRDITAKAFNDAMLERSMETKYPTVADLEKVNLRILNDARLKSILDIEEIPFFRLYIGNVINVCAETLGEPNLKDIVVDYVSKYIHDNIYNQNTFHD